METKTTGKREKLAPKQKRCFGCKKVKHKFKDFKPRWGRCQKHKEQGKPFSEKCKGCVEARGSNIRQPRCIECDAQRVKKETAAPVTAKVSRKKKVAAAAPVAAPEAPVTPVTVTAPAAPEAQAVATTPPPAVPAPAPVPSSTDTLAAVAGLLDSPQGEQTSPF